MQPLAVCIGCLAVIVTLLSGILPMILRLCVAYLFSIYPVRYFLGKIPWFYRTGKLGGWIVTLTVPAFIFGSLGFFILNFKGTPNLTLNCELVSLPVKWESGPMRSIEIRGRFVAGFGQHTRGSDKLPGLWPEENMKNSEARQYTMTNYGSFVIYDARLDFKLIHREAEVTNGGISDGDVVHTQTSSMRTGKLDPNGGSSTFYMRNISDDFIEIESPKFAILDDGRKIPLKRTGKPDLPLSPDSLWRNQK